MCAMCVDGKQKRKSATNVNLVQRDIYQIRNETSRETERVSERMNETKRGAAYDAEMNVKTEVAGSKFPSVAARVAQTSW